MCEESFSEKGIENSGRSVRVFVSSTFRDMREERDALMSHAWPELRCFCNERDVELIEVDMRWGISEEQARRNETLKLCLDEVHACRPYFIGILGERYGWIPSSDAISPDLREEQPWVGELDEKSVTELEILHGVLNNPAMKGRALFYFRDPDISKSRGLDFLSENENARQRQTDLKSRIRMAYKAGQVELYENFTDSKSLSDLILYQLKRIVEEQFPLKNVPDELSQEEKGHSLFAEAFRKTYIRFDGDFQRLDEFAKAKGGPLVVSGKSGSGKSALLANWIMHWRKNRPHSNDFIFQHYIGGTPDSSSHWQLIRRLISEIKSWCGDATEVPVLNEDLARDFRQWLLKAKAKAERDGVRCVFLIDALDQLQAQGSSHSLGWLPDDCFNGSLRLIVSTTSGETLDVADEIGAEVLSVKEFSEDERRKMIHDYLRRFGKKLDEGRIEEIISVSATSNPLYLKIMLDELRVTGTHEKLDERLRAYLSSSDISSLLRNVLRRFEQHYGSGLTKNALCLIYSARRGLSEKELLQLLRPEGLEQLPAAIWSPLRYALEGFLVDRSGILNFVHDHFRTVVGDTFLSTNNKTRQFRLQLIDYFESVDLSSRSCDELPWLYSQTGEKMRLRSFLLSVDNFCEVFTRNESELRNYWLELGEYEAVGEAYKTAYDQWSEKLSFLETFSVVEKLALFLGNSGAYATALQLYRSLPELPGGGIMLSPKGNTLSQKTGLARLLIRMGGFEEAESLFLSILEPSQDLLGSTSLQTLTVKNDLACLWISQGRFEEAEQAFREILKDQESLFGFNHPSTILALNNLALSLQNQGKYTEAKKLYTQAMPLFERVLGTSHPGTLTSLNNLAIVSLRQDDLLTAESICQRLTKTSRQALGEAHPITISIMNTFAALLEKKGDFVKAVVVYKDALIGLLDLSIGTGKYPQNFDVAFTNYDMSLRKCGYKEEEVHDYLLEILQAYEHPEHENGTDVSKVTEALIKGEEAVSYMEHVWAERIAFWHVSAEMGDPDGQYLYGQCCYDGLGGEESKEEGARWFSKSAEHGNSLAQWKLGVCYINGLGVTSDLQKGIHWLMKSVWQECAMASYRLSICCMNGIGVEQNVEQAIQFACFAGQAGMGMGWHTVGFLYEHFEKNAELAMSYYQLAAKQGIADSIFAQANFYMQGNGVEKDLHRAIELYIDAANKGSMHAMNNLACFYAQGTGVEQDDKKASEWGLKAAELGLKEAQLMMGERFLSGKGMPKDEEKGKALLWQARKQGSDDAFHLLVEIEDPDALYDVANYLHQNNKIESAVFYYRKSAEQGHPIAQYNLAWCMGTGTGVEQNEEQAVKLYQASAKQGFAPAQYEVGVFYLVGKVVEKDQEKAKEWLGMAANQGNLDAVRLLAEAGVAQAQCHLGLLYYEGDGVEKNLSEAKKWYRKAAEQGDADAVRMLAQMNGE